MSDEAQIVDPAKKYSDEEIINFSKETFFELIGCLDVMLKWISLRPADKIDLLYKKSRMCFVWSLSPKCPEGRRVEILNLARDCITRCTHIDMLYAKPWKLKAKILGALGLRAEQEDCFEIVGIANTQV